MSGDGCARCDDTPTTHRTTASGAALCQGCAEESVARFGPDSVEDLPA